MFFDLMGDHGFKRSIFNAFVMLQPIRWINSCGGSDNVNMALFSPFNLVLSAPSVLIFSCNIPADRVKKDTLASVRAPGEFVYNLVSHALVGAMNTTSASVPYDSEKFELAGGRLPLVYMSRRHAWRFHRLRLNATCCCGWPRLRQKARVTL